MAMYQAKHDGRNRYMVFEPTMKAQVEESMALELELRRAVDNMDFYLCYQPKVDIDTGALVGAEALIRWKREDFISPAVFIPVAEETGLISRIGAWVIETAVEDLARWKNAYSLPPGFRVSVNISVQQLENAKLAEEMEAALKLHGLNPEMLEIEITEGLFLEQTDLNMQRLARIRKLGVGIALDDFGTGYSSMSYLAQLPLTVLKIDKAFVDEIHGPQGKAIVSAVVALAKGLAVDVIAEGVEHLEQAEELLRLGCPQAQGYYYSKPLVLDQFDSASLA